MNPRILVLLYSKYSTNCQKLIETIQVNRIQIPNLQSLCIDNKKIRKRILENKQFDVSVVPCILSVFENGTVEKYEGDYSFQFVEQFIVRQQPPSQSNLNLSKNQPLPFREEPENIVDDRYTKPKELEREPERKKLNRNKNYGPTTTINDFQFEEDDQEMKLSSSTNNLFRNGNRNETEDEPETEAGNMNLNPSEEFQKSDRNTTKPNPKRIRNNDMSYNENDEFFSDEQPETRIPTINVKKDTKTSGLQDPHGTSKKASDLQKERDMMDETILPNKQRPIGMRAK